MMSDTAHLEDTTMGNKELIQPARARTSDPSTSHEAAASLTPETITKSQRLILRTLMACGPGGATDEQIYDRLNRYRRLPAMSLSGARTRRKELVNAGAIHEGGRRLMRSKRYGTVWRITEAGAVVWRG